MTSLGSLGPGSPDPLEPPASPWRPPVARARAFPPNFAFGAATSAYQIEGAAAEGGRGPSIWDTFASLPGTVVDGSDGLIAADHYHRFREDVGLMADLGLNAYRFSTSWARVMPDGEHINQTGLDFYSRLVDSLLDANITPWLTLYHWDLPQAIEDRGGWRERDIAERFTNYALTMLDALGDRVTNWLTLNEPWCTAFLGHSGGQHAPGIQDDAASLRVLHHLLLAHGEATRAMRASRDGLTIGLAPNFSLYSPLSQDNPADVDTVRRLRQSQFGCFLEPVLKGHYPADFLADVGDRWCEDVVHAGDLEVISTPIDVLGVNYYNSWIIAGPDGSDTVAPSGASDDAGVSPWLTARDSRWVRSQAPRTEMDWESHAGAFRELLVWLDQLVRPVGAHLIVTENGVACPDDDVVAGTVQDHDRITYTSNHLAAVHEAMEEGADVRAYLHWTLLDNFEWAYGYTKTFGLVSVDPVTRDRRPKLSAQWYADLIATKKLPGPEGEKP